MLKVIGNSVIIKTNVLLKLIFLIIFLHPFIPLRCIHNGLIKKHSSLGRGLNEFGGAAKNLFDPRNNYHFKNNSNMKMASDVENNSNLRVNSDFGNHNNLTNHFEPTTSNLKNSWDLRSNSNLENNTNSKSEANEKEFLKQQHLQQQQHHFQQQTPHNPQKHETTKLKSNKSNNHNNNEPILNNDLNAYFMGHTFSQQPIFADNQPIFDHISTNLPNLNTICHQDHTLPYNPFLPKEPQCPHENQHHQNDQANVDAATKGNIFNNIAFLMNRFRTRYFSSSRPSECGSSKGILKYLYNNFLDQENCDFIVKTKNGDVMSHQLVVASFSPSVDTYLKSQKKKIQQPLMVNLEDCSLEAVSNVLNFLYTTDITLNSLNIGFIANVSVRLDLPVLNHVSNDYLIQTLDIDNAFLHLSVSINNKFLSAVHIFKFIALNFFDLIEHEHLLLLPFENFYTLTTHPSLRAKEVEVFMSVANWINFNRPCRMKHAKALLPLIKFHLIDPQQLAKYVENQEWVFNDDENKRIILDAYKLVCKLI